MKDKKVKLTAMSLAMSSFWLVSGWEARGTGGGNGAGTGAGSSISHRPPDTGNMSKFRPIN